MITSVVHYRSAAHSRRLQAHKEWCILSLQSNRNMNSSGPVARTLTCNLNVSVSSSSSTSSEDCCRATSLDSLLHCDDNDNVVSRAHHQLNNHFKYRKALGTRQGEVQAIRTKYPSKIPVIVERFDQELSLPHLQKSKFLVPQELSMSQLITVVRNRLRLSSTQAIFLMVNNRSIASLSKTCLEIYREHRDPDGFLYVTYASQEAFGSPCPHSAPADDRSRIIRSCSLA